MDESFVEFPELPDDTPIPPPAPDPADMLPSEAVHLFAILLSGLEESIVVGGHAEAGGLPELVAKFIHHFNLEAKRPDWNTRIPQLLAGGGG